MSQTKYTFNQVDEGNANILINGEIDSWWGTGLGEVAEKVADSKAQNIQVQVNSPGGSVTEGLAIAAFLKGYPAKVDTTGLGLVASIATTILLAGEKVTMSEGSFFMIHNPWGMAVGEAEEMRETADLLDTMQDELADIYVKAIAKNKKLVSGRKDSTKKQVLDWMNKETWFTAKEAKDAGFISEVTEGVEFLTQNNAKAIYNSCAKFNNVPTEFLNKVKKYSEMTDENKNQGEVNETSFWNFFRNLFKNKPTEVKDLINGLEEQKEEEKVIEISKEDEIAKAMEFLKAEGIIKDEVKEEAVETPAEETAEEVVEEVAETNEELDALKAKLASAQAKLQAIEEEKAGAPSAGDGGASDTQNKSISKQYAPTATHKEALKAVGKLFN